MLCMAVLTMVGLVLGGLISPAVAEGPSSLLSVDGSPPVSSSPSPNPSYSSVSSVEPSTAPSTALPDSCTLAGPALSACLPSYNLQAAQDSHRLVQLVVPALALLLFLGGASVVLALGRR